MQVKLHGILGHKFKREISFPSEIDASFLFDALSANLNGFKLFIQRQAQEGSFYQTIKMKESYHIVPVICGNIAAVGNFALNQIGNFLGSFAGSMALGGIMNLITPAEEEAFNVTKDAVVLQSTRFQNLENKEEQGSKVPVGYGRLRIGSKLVMQYSEHQNWSDDRNIDNVLDFSLPLQEYMNPAT